VVRSLVGAGRLAGVLGSDREQRRVHGGGEVAFGGDIVDLLQAASSALMRELLSEVADPRGWASRY